MFEIFNFQYHHIVVQSASEAQVGAHSPAGPSELLRMQKIVVRDFPATFKILCSAESWLIPESTRANVF